MLKKESKVKRMNRKPEPKWAFKMMSLIHDNPLRRNFTDPYKTLKAAGLKPGQKVLEIGCGPGFFTIPAAKIVGEKGTGYSPIGDGKCPRKDQKRRNKKCQDYLSRCISDPFA